MLKTDLFKDAVDTVFVEGELKLKDKRLQGFDEEEILKKDVTFFDEGLKQIKKQLRK